MAVVIRRAEATEAEALTALAIRAKASHGYPEAWIDAWRPALTFTAELFESCTVLVAEESDAGIVGVVALGGSGFGGERSGGAVPSGEGSPAEAELEHLWVDPGAQGRGVGRALMAAIVEVASASGVRSVRIESDPGARPFYERLGARYEGEVAAPVLDVLDRTLPVLRIAVAGSGSAPARR